MRAGGPSVCSGSVVHRRLRPTTHEFRYPLSYVWIDPDDPSALCDAHPLWSSTHVAPARFRRSDYGARPTGSLAAEVRRELASALAGEPAGDVRLLTQVRRWGWLFNPITVYVAWDIDPDRPVGAVLEVTNTPWKERHRYPISLSEPDQDGWMTSVVDKELHVSPFLDEDSRYEVRLRGADDRIDFELDVVPHGGNTPIVTAAVTLDRQPATRTALGAALRAHPLPTHRVSAGIHAQAVRLWRKGVPFVAHPNKRAVVS